MITCACIPMMFQPYVICRGIVSPLLLVFILFTSMQYLQLVKTKNSKRRYISEISTSAYASVQNDHENGAHFSMNFGRAIL